MGATEEYLNAMKLGMKEMPGTFNLNENTSFLPVLDEILKNEQTCGEEKLGLENIPLDLVVGTKTKGRTTSFAPNFMPILEYRSEFAVKWQALCKAHLEEGIRDPIIVYEYLNRYYVVEGNKRVSVLKYYHASTVPAYVTRVIPEPTDDPERQIYYEYMKFHKYSHVNYLLFSQVGSYDRLLNLMEMEPDHEWTPEEQTDFRSAYVRFEQAYTSKRQTGKLNITVGDAFLAFLNIYGYEDIQDKLPNEIREDIPKVWEEFSLLTEEQSVALMLNPDKEATAEKKPGFISSILPPAKKKIAFIHSKTAETSSWTYAHELGRMYLDQVFPTQITTHKVDQVTEENADEILEGLVKEGYTIFFFTTPNLMEASLKLAVEHPELAVLTCSLNTSHRYIRNYYARMYEAKFISGAIAGALTDTDHLGYIATYPIYGMTANINAFALGAKMTNPRAKIHLAWSCLRPEETGVLEERDENLQSTEDIYRSFRELNISHISENDMITPASVSKAYGLMRIEDNGELKPLSTTIWDWGKLYERIIRLIINGAWKKDASEERAAINYWWGMSAGVIDLVLSREVTPDTRRLVNLLRHAISTGEFNPFSGELISSDGRVISSSQDYVMAPEDIVTMNWLNENVIGTIPSMDQLSEETRKLIEVMGVIES